MSSGELAASSGWGNLPSHVLDNILCCLCGEENDSPSNWPPWTTTPNCTRKTLLVTARCVNHHWSKWASEATQTLTPQWSRGTTKLLKSRVAQQFVNVRVLNVLDQEGWFLRDHDLYHVAQFSRLESLYLEDCWEITDDGIRYLQSLPSLTRLCLSTDSGILACPELKTISSLKSLVDLGLHTWGNFTCLENMTGLTSLSLLTCHNIALDALKSIESMRSLVTLVLMRCEIMIDDPLKCFEGMTTLRSLTVSVGRFTDESMMSVAKMTALTSLVLDSCYPVTDEGVYLLLDMTGLTNLDLKGSTGITEDAIKRLEGLPNLVNFEHYSFSFDHSDYEIEDYEYDDFYDDFGDDYDYPSGQEGSCDGEDYELCDDDW